MKNIILVNKNFEIHTTLLEKLSIDRYNIKIELDDISEKRYIIEVAPYQAIKVITIDCLSSMEYFDEYCFRDGIISKQRQYVHLSNDIETAKEVAKRHSNDYVILKINAKQAYLDGVKFYHGNEQTWLSDYIAPEYLTLD